MTKDLMITSVGNLQIEDSEYVRLVSQITDVWDKARDQAAIAVNTELLEANWQTGRYIVEFEQKGNVKAEYGKQLLTNLAKDLTRLRGKGYSRSNLFNMRLFYIRFQKIQTVSGQLSWSHYLELLKCDDPMEMQFYKKECINQGWKVRELKRQIKSSLFQRLALSTDKEGLLALANEGHQVQKAADIIRDPFVLEFTGLPKQKQYKEKDLEDALKENMEKFLLELGKGFSFVARQKRIMLEDDEFFIDLVLYNRLLRCFVVIEIKTGKITHQDIGQLQMYVNYHDRVEKLPEENPTIGILLCAGKNDSAVKMTLPENNKTILASEYKLYLPTTEQLVNEINEAKELAKKRENHLIR